MTPNIADIIRHHVSLEVRCIDRLYLHAYMPKLQTSGGVCYFLRDYLGYPIASPALFKPIHDRFVTAVEQFAARHAIPVVEFESGQDKDAIANAHRARFVGHEGVVLVGTAQEKVRSFKAHKHVGPGVKVHFEFSRQWVAVKQFYFYVHDRDWGPAFLKISTYLPYAVKLCLNGHEWVKQQLRRRRIPFEALDNGFLSCPDPVALQTVSDALGVADVQGFFERWSQRLPCRRGECTHAGGGNSQGPAAGPTRVIRTRQRYGVTEEGSCGVIPAARLGRTKSIHTPFHAPFSEFPEIYR